MKDYKEIKMSTERVVTQFGDFFEVRAITDNITVSGMARSEDLATAICLNKLAMIYKNFALKWDFDNQNATLDVINSNTLQSIVKSVNNYSEGVGSTPQLSLFTNAEQAIDAGLIQKQMGKQKQKVYVIEHGFWHPNSWDDSNLEKVFATKEQALGWISTNYPEYMDHDEKGRYFQGPACKYIAIHEMEMEP